MRRHIRQCALDLGVTEIPERLLRAAFERTPIRWRLSFEDAMQVPMWRICIRNLAISMQRRLT